MILDSHTLGHFLCNQTRRQMILFTPWQEYPAQYHRKRHGRGSKKPCQCTFEKFVGQEVRTRGERNCPHREYDKLYKLGFRLSRRDAPILSQGIAYKVMI